MYPRSCQCSRTPDETRKNNNSTGFLFREHTEEQDSVGQGRIEIARTNTRMESSKQQNISNPKTKATSFLRAERHLA
jgi:hypothetical protein